MDSLMTSRLFRMVFCFIFVVGTLVGQLQLPVLNSSESQIGAGSDRIVVTESEELKTRRKTVIPTLDLTILDNQKDFAEQLYACEKDEKKPAVHSQVMIREIFTVPLGIYAPPFIF